MPPQDGALTGESNLAWWAHQLIDYRRRHELHEEHHFELVHKWSDNLIHVSCEKERLDWSINE